MPDVQLTRNLLNANKILFHYGKLLEHIQKGETNFNPIAIEIHPTAKCNHRCIHCSYRERNESRNSISEKVMDQLMDSIIRMNIRAVYFSGGGEPTLYPSLKERIQFLTDHEVECSIITNGSCFDQMGLVDIADRLNYIAVSVPGVDQGVFKEITGTNNLNEVLSLPGKIKEQHGDHAPIIGSRIVLTNKNYKQVKDFLGIIKEKMFDYALFKIVRDYEDNGQGLNPDEEAYLKQEVFECDEIDENFTNIKHIFDYRKNPEFKNCCWTNRLGLIANVSTDGKVYPNIVEIDKEEFCIGDLNEMTLEQMWSSGRHQIVKKRSDEKWLNGECKNCRAISYNRIINEMNERIPTEYDPFI